MEGKQRTTYSSYLLLWQSMGTYQLSTRGTKNVPQSVKRCIHLFHIQNNSYKWLSIQFVTQNLNIQSVCPFWGPPTHVWLHKPSPWGWIKNRLLANYFWQNTFTGPNSTMKKKPTNQTYLSFILMFWSVWGSYINLMSCRCNTGGNVRNFTPFSAS